MVSNVKKRWGEGGGGYPTSPSPTRGKPVHGTTKVKSTIYLVSIETFPIPMKISLGNPVYTDK